MSTPFEAIAPEHHRHGWPESFVSDLTVHDREFLEKRDLSLPFGWAARATGTDLYTQGDWWECVWAYHANKLYPPPFQRWYWWDGERLSEISFEEFAERLRNLGEEMVGDR